MSSINRNGGLGGSWFKPNRQENTAANGETASTSKKSGDTANFSFSTGRLAELAGGFARTIEQADPASDLVKKSGNLREFIENSLERSLGRKVNLGSHGDKLAAYVEDALAKDGYPSFEELKGKVG